jgi:hypothetical protein
VEVMGLGIWEVQTYSVIRGKEEEHEEVIKQVGVHVLKMGKKYLCFDKLHGPVNAKVMVISHINFADLEKFEADWWADEKLTELGDHWFSCVEYDSYKQTFWQETPVE